MNSIARGLMSPLSLFKSRRPATFLGILFILTALAATPGLAAGDYHLSFGPHIGGGNTSSGESVRHSSGYVLSLERGWQLSDRWQLGPRFELGNNFVNTRATEGETRTVATYDNRIVAAGLSLSTAIGADLNQRLYLSTVAGRGFSKL